MRVARSRRLVAEGYALATVARVLKVSRQALYRTPKPRTVPQRRPPADPIEQAIVELAQANQTDGYRMVCAFGRRKLGVAVNRKRVLRVMRERKLIQRRRPVGCQNSLRAPRNPRLEAGRYFWHPTPLRGRLVLGEQPLCERVADELGRNRRTPTPTPSQRSPSPTGGPNCCWARAAWATRPMKMVSGRSSVITIPCSCKSVTGPS